MTDILSHIEDPKDPRYKMRWHRVPTFLKPAAMLAGAVCLAFGGCEVHPLNDPDEWKAYRIYDFSLFRLLETSRGNWYFKAG